MSRCRCGEPERAENWNLSGCGELRKLKDALQRIAAIDQDYDAKLVGHYLLKKKCKIIAKEALAL